MAGVADSRIYKAGPWPRGICNATEEGVLPLNDFGSRPVALRDAANVDLTATGNVSRRDGYALAAAMVLGHSLWSDEALPYGLYVDNGVLHAVHQGVVVTSLNTVVGNLPLSYARLGDRVFFTSRSGCGMVLPSLDVVSWGVSAPAGQPLLAAVTGAALTKGQYQVAVTFTDSLGRESGSTLAAPVQVEDNGGIQLTAIPQPLDSHTTAVNIYCTAADATVLRLFATLPLGVLDAVIGASPQGRPLVTQFLADLPAGQIVRFGHGRQWVARANELYWSEPLRYGQYNAARNRMRFDGEITLLEPLGEGAVGEAGVYVSANGRTYWLQGADPADFRQRTIAHEGVVRGSSWREGGRAFGGESSGTVVFWLADNGKFRIGAKNGTISDTNETALVDGADAAAVLRRTLPGMEQLVVSLRAAQPQRAAATDACVTYHVPAAAKQ